MGQAEAFIAARRDTARIQLRTFKGFAASLKEDHLNATIAAKKDTQSQPSECGFVAAKNEAVMIIATAMHAAAAESEQSESTTEALPIPFSAK